MIDITKLARPSILRLIPYNSARNEKTPPGAIWLDANENPCGPLGRYPDPCQRELKSKLASLKKVKTENLLIGNGSDEITDLLLRAFCEPGKDKIMIFPPTYGMYEVSAAIHDIQVIKIPLNRNFQPYPIDTGLLLTPGLKIIFICSPNNPTGNLINPEYIKTLLSQFRGLVVIDEAYIDFCPEASWLPQLSRYPNLVVLQTLSKAWGLAGARIGMGFANPGIIKLLDKIKPPYNVSTLNQQAALEALSQPGRYSRNLHYLVVRKKLLATELVKLAPVKRIYPSEANFLLVEFRQAEKVYRHLYKCGIVVRNRSREVRNCLRITVGKEAENRLLLEALNQIS